MFRNPTTDLIVVLVVVLLIFGPKRLPGLGKSLGQGMREFKDSITGKDADDSQRSELTQASADAQVTPAPPVSEPQAVRTPPATPAHDSAERNS